MEAMFVRPLQAHLTYARSVEMGVQNGLEECKHQFAWDKWNCPDTSTQLRGLRRGRCALDGTT